MKKHVKIAIIVLSISRSTLDMRYTGFELKLKGVAVCTRCKSLSLKSVYVNNEELIAHKNHITQE